ncbi:hypothetical protein P0W64_01980 [Tsukamurella sp. 8F]|uniref:hypothetical protein n=1 Tax=Tsukamurella sp. 8F TaxID=3031961 RepID=UPI0023B970A4|nr:hypothetical protein [Tsukamurella sp. 8F]MDF0585542.1 hypothetical protein [Tsukamurella sp. 8F]
MTFHGCEVLDHLDPGNADFEKAVEPVVRTQEPYGPSFDPSTLQFTPRGYPVTWNNRDDNAEVVLTPESFRPNVPWTTDVDDYVVVARAPEATEVQVSWMLTEDANDEVTAGEIQVSTDERLDAAALFETLFFHGD